MASRGTTRPTSSTAAAAKKATSATAAAPAKRAPARQASARQAPAKQAPAKKAPAAKAAATKKAPAKAPAAKAPAKSTAKTTAASAPAKKAPAAKAPAKAAAPARVAAATAPVAKATPAAKPTPPKTPYDAKFLGQQREALDAARSERLRQSEILYAEAVSLTENREPGDVQFDEESGEGDTLAVERERDLALSAQALAEVEEIDAAIQRIEDRTYGVCRVSGQPIPKERLRAIPWATERVEYKVGGFGRR